MLTLEQRKAKAESLKGREVRTVAVHDFEVREDADGLLTMDGWASVTERSYDMGYYQETIKRGAFGKTLRESPDVQLLINHDGLPLARTRDSANRPIVGAGSLALSEDDQGLRVAARLDPADPDVMRLMPKVSRGLVDQMSFGFRVTRQTWDEDYENRDIAEVNIDRGDVSIVNQGANPATSFSLRSLLAGDIDPGELEAMRGDLTRLLYPTRHNVDALTAVFADIRAGKQFSDANMAVLKDCLSRVADADDAVDQVLVNLSALIGVPNPDSDAARSLDIYRARAHASALRGRSSAA